MTMTSQFVDMTLWLNFFDVVLFRLSSLVTGPSFMAISSLVLELWQFFYEELTRNPEIRNTPVWHLPNIWGFGRVRDTKFGTNVSNKILRNTAKCQDYSFYRFWVIKGKLTRGGGEEGRITALPPPLRLGLRENTKDVIDFEEKKMLPLTKEGLKLH